MTARRSPERSTSLTDSRRRPPSSPFRSASKASPGITYWYPSRDKNSPPAEFQLDWLAPGDYLVFAFDHAEGLEYTNRDVLQSYVSQAAHVTLSPNQRAKVTLELIRTREAAN